MIQGDQDALGYPQRPRLAQLWGVQQVPVMSIKSWYCACSYTILKIIRFKTVPRWLWCSWTPSATSSSSIMASTASTSYVHQKLTWHIFIHYFSKTKWFQTAPVWYLVIKMLLDTHSDLVKLNHGRLNKNQFCSSKIDMAHVYILNMHNINFWWT